MSKMAIVGHVCGAVGWRKPVKISKEALLIAAQQAKKTVKTEAADAAPASSEPPPKKPRYRYQR